MKHRELDDFGDQEGDGHGHVLGRVDGLQIEIDRKPARRFGGARREARQHSSDSSGRSEIPRFSSISAKWLRWTIDKRADPAADRGIGGARLGRLGGAAMDVEQGRDDLQVVLHPVVDLADEPPLPFEAPRHFTFRLLDPAIARVKGSPQFLDFRRRAELARQIERSFAWLIGQRPRVRAGAADGSASG